MKARAFNDNYETVRDLLKLACEVAAARSNLYRAFTNYTQACNERLKHTTPKGTDFRLKVNAIRSDRDAGKFITFITGHKPARDGF